MKAIDYVILILLGLVVIVIIGYMVLPTLARERINVEEPTRSPLARFIRYLGCAVVMCTHGCESDEVITHALEYEGNKIVKSCHQLIEEKGWCDGLDPGTKLCSDDDTKYVFNFTFEKDVTYRTNYSVDRWDPRTYGTCAFPDDGWQTDASCIGRWEDSNLIDDPCRDCKLDVPASDNPAIGSIPTGVLISYGDESECGVRGNEIVVNYDHLAGSLYVSENYANNNCEKSSNWETSYTDNEYNCDFNTGDTFWIWSVENGVSATVWEFDIWGMHVKRVMSCVGTGWYRCPKIVICDHEPT